VHNSNYQEARLAFWEDTALPLLDMILTDWNAWLAGPLKVEIRADVDSIPAIAEKRLKMWEMANASTDLTINERRALKGYGPVEGGDVLFVSSAEIPLSMAGEMPEPIADMDAETVKRLAYGSQAS
jgi:phage portal protein BeeE